MDEIKFEGFLTEDTGIISKYKLGTRLSKARAVEKCLTDLDSIVVVMIRCIKHY